MSSFFQNHKFVGPLCNYEKSDFKIFCLFYSSGYTWPEDRKSGSKAGYRDDDDLMSHYMGQSAYGGASNIGVEVGSNAGDRYGAH